MATNSYDEVLRIVIKQEGESELGKLAKAILDAGKAGGVAEDQLGLLTDQLDRIAKQREAIAAFTRTSAGLFELSGKLDEAKAKVAALAAAQQAAGGATAASVRELKQAEQAVARLEREQARLELQLTRSNVALQRAGIDANALVDADQQLADQLGQVRVQLTEMADAAGEAGEETSTLAGITEKVRGAFGNAAGALLEFGGKLAAITGIAGLVSGALAALNVGRFFGGAIESASQLEAALSEVAAVSGASADQLARMKVAAEDASASTKFTVVEATNALGELARASGDAEQAIAQLPATLALAQAAGIGASESATILTTTITQFGLAATDATRIADLFAREANSTNDTVTGLGLAMSYAAPLARQLGMDVEGTTAAIGALADQGFRGERAGTALRNVLSQLANPSSKFNAELYALGITTKDFNEVIFQLADAGEKGNKALLALDSEARPAIASLVNSGGAGIKRLAADLKNAGGEAAATAKTMGENFDAATTRFGGALDFLRRALVEPLLAPLAKQFDGAAERIRAFVATADFKKLADSIKDFAVRGAESIVQFVSSIDFTEATRRLTSFVETLTGFIADIAKRTSGLSATLGIIGNTISLFWNGLQTVILAGASVITGAVSLIGRAFITLQEGIAKLAGTYEALRPFFDKSREALLGLNAVAEEFGKRATTNGAEAAAAFKGLTESMTAAAKAAADAASPFGNVAAGVKTAGEEADRTIEGFDHLTGKFGELKDELIDLPEYLKPVTAETLASVSAARLAGDAAAEYQRKLALARGEVDVMRQALQLLTTSGETNAETFQAAQKSYADAQARLAALTGTANETKISTEQLTAAFDTLGITSQATLTETAATAAKAVEDVSTAYRAGLASIEDQVRAVQAWAEAERAASAISSDAVKAATERKIEARIAALGLTEQMEKLGVTGANAGKAISDGMFHAKASIDGLRGAASAAQATLIAMADDATTTVAGLIYELNKANTSYDELGESGKAAYDKVLAAQNESRAGLSAGIAGVYDEWAAYFAGISEGATAAFQDVAKGAARTASDVASYFEKISTGSVDLKQRIIDQQASVEALTAGYESFGDRAGGSLQAVSSALERNLRNLQGARADLKLLDEASLAKLDAAIAGTRGKLDALRESARSAKEQLATLADDLQNELDQQDGKAAAVEQRRFDRQKAQIDELAKSNNVANSAEHQAALARAEELHRRKLEDLQTERAAAAQPALPAAPTQPARPTNAAQPSTGAAAVNQTNNFEIHGIFAGSAQELARLLKPELDKIARLGQ